MTQSPLQDRLRRLRRRVRGIAGASGLGWGLVTAGLVVLAGAWADLVMELSPALRIAAPAVALLVGATLALVATRRAWRQGEPRPLASRLDGIAGARGEIISGADLLLDRRDRTPLGAGLAAIAIGRAADLAQDVPGPRVAPARPMAVASLALGLLVGGVTMVSLGLPAMARALWLRFSDPFGDHPPYSPVVLRVEPGDVTVVYGRGIEVRATAEGAAVDPLELVLETSGAPPERLPMFPEGNGRWRTAIADVTAPGRYFVRGGRARSRRHRIEVITLPRLVGVRVRVTPPAYTRRPAYDGPPPAGGLAGLPGTRVEVWATSNRPLSGGTLQLTATNARGEPRLTPTAPGGKEVHGAFEIREEGKVEVRVRDVDGQDSPEPLSTSLVLLRDDRPIIRIVEPRETSFATPDIQLPVVLAAEDDYGIAHVQLFRSLNGSRALPIEFPIGGDPPARWDDRAYLPLSEYGLRPGDEIKLFARAEDNDPAGPKGSESAVVTIRIIPREVFDRLTSAREGIEALTARYREAERRLEALADEAARLQEELEKLPPGSDLAKEHAERLQKLAERFREEAAAIRESARHPLRYDIDKNLSRELEALAKALAEMAGEAERSSRRSVAQERRRRQGPRRAPRPPGRRAEAVRRERADAGRVPGAGLPPPRGPGAIRAALSPPARPGRSPRLAQGTRGRRRPAGQGPDARPRSRAAAASHRPRSIARRHRGARPTPPRRPQARRPPQDGRVVRRRRQGRRRDGSHGRGRGRPRRLQRHDRGRRRPRRRPTSSKRLLAKCSGQTGMGSQGQACLSFQPALPGNLGNSIEQMLAGAGLPRPGAGMGQGTGPAGDGYSARRSTLDNVGLYGGRPPLGSSPRSGSGRSGAGGGPGRATAPPGGRNPTDLLGVAGKMDAVGQAQAPIPAPYRRRVADYFQRIAEETGER